VLLRSSGRRIGPIALRESQNDSRRRTSDSEQLLHRASRRHENNTKRKFTWLAPHHVSPLPRMREGIVKELPPRQRYSSVNESDWLNRRDDRCDLLELSRVRVLDCHVDLDYLYTYQGVIQCAPRWDADHSSSSSNQRSSASLSSLSKESSQSTVS